MFDHTRIRLGLSGSLSDYWHRPLVTCRWIVAFGQSLTASDDLVSRRIMELPSLEPAALSPALLDGLHSLQCLKHLEGAAADLHHLPAAARSLQSAADSLERFHTRLLVIGVGFWAAQGFVRWAWSRWAAPSSASACPTAPATADEITIAGAIRCAAQCSAAG